MTRFIVLIAASVLSAAAMAGDTKDKAYDTTKSTAATFESLDKNADQQISKAEADLRKHLQPGEIPRPFECPAVEPAPERVL